MQSKLCNLGYAIYAMQSMLCYLGCAIYATRSTQSKLNGRLLVAGVMYLGLTTWAGADWAQVPRLEPRTGNPEFQATGSSA